jgi:hypothetical protein
MSHLDKVIKSVMSATWDEVKDDFVTKGKSKFSNFPRYTNLHGALSTEFYRSRNTPQICSGRKPMPLTAGRHWGRLIFGRS